MTKHCIFSHGFGGHPKGKKIYYLSRIAKTFGYTCHAIDYTDLDNPDERAERLNQYIIDNQLDNITLVGSSMGSYVSLVNAEKTNVHVDGVFLMAPAVYLPRYQQTQFKTLNCPVEIVHGWKDDVVLYEHAVRYANTTNSTLHLINDNHRLSEQPEYVQQLFSAFLDTLSKTE